MTIDNDGGWSWSSFIDLDDGFMMTKSPVHTVSSSEDMSVRNKCSSTELTSWPATFWADLGGDGGGGWLG